MTDQERYVKFTQGIIDMLDTAPVLDLDMFGTSVGTEYLKGMAMPTGSVKVKLIEPSTLETAIGLIQGLLTVYEEIAAGPDLPGDPA
jgi:hypothetical protein